MLFCLILPYECLIPIWEADKLAEAIEFCAQNIATLGEYVYQYVHIENLNEAVENHYRQLINEILK